MPTATGGNVAQSPQTWAGSLGTPGPPGERSGQCPINKQCSFKPLGPQPPGQGLTGSLLDSDKKLAQGAVTGGRRSTPLLCPCTPQGSPQLTGEQGGLAEAETGKRQAWLSLAPSCQEQLLWQMSGEDGGGSCRARCKCLISSTCPGPPGAAAPHSSGRSAGTSGSSPPLQSDTPHG